jgi:hypothetical protein
MNILAIFHKGSMRAFDTRVAVGNNADADELHGAAASLRADPQPILTAPDVAQLAINKRRRS